MPASFSITFAVFSVKVIVLVYRTPPSLKLSLAVPYTACVCQHYIKFDVILIAIPHLG